MLNSRESRDTKRERESYNNKKMPFTRIWMVVRVEGFMLKMGASQSLHHCHVFLFCCFC